MKIWAAVIDINGEDQVVVDPDDGHILAVSFLELRDGLIEAISKSVIEEPFQIKLVRFEDVKEELRFCPTCGSTTEVDGDCPHCNPLVEEIKVSS